MAQRSEFEEIQELLRRKADCNARLALIPYEGTPEVKTLSGKRYLYMRKRVAGKLTSTYVDQYSEELHQLLLRNAAEARELRKQIRRLDKQLGQLGFEGGALAARVALNLDFARANMSASIYDQAVLEGVATSFPQTEEILNNGKVSGMTATDVQKVLNLKHAWEFVLDRDVLLCESSFAVLSHIATLVNEGFFADGGRVRGVPVSIGGTSYVPPLPHETVVKERIAEILGGGKDPVDEAIELVLYCMKTQIFLDGNKRASVIFANHRLISRGGGLLVVPEGEVAAFKELLIRHYEGTGSDECAAFLKERCWRTF
jgi:hypothetical protein